MVKKGVPPKKISTKMFSSEVKFNKRKQSVVLPTKHNLLKIAIINLQQQKLHKNYHRSFGHPNNSSPIVFTSLKQPSCI